ncbi:MAG: ammonia-forming cytochrome c nitrite reductase [Ignavibacteriae bacterium]|nr:ammonia-forming cytochrome c nitrite reductase [Ignavibacteriota bacterium]
MSTLRDLVRMKPWTGWVLFAATVAVVFLAGLFGASIIERRAEQGIQLQPVRAIPEWEPRNSVWGENYPREYESYIATRDTGFSSKYGGSRMRDILAEDPRPVILWAGYAFSRDYNQARGHYYAIDDIRKTLRTGVPQPATCWTCKSTDVPRVMSRMGAAAFYKSSWADLGPEIVNHIGCQDCHDPKTMNLRITRPALAEAFQRQGKSIEEATHQEMRSLVCAQCHVEYYFKGKTEKYLTFPWDKGFSPDAMEAYYDSIGHVDFIHALSRTPVLKAQHPDYELFRTGIHAQRGISCADCHMPYKSEGGVKFSNHWMRSPLANIAGSCQVCHRESEEELTRNVNDRQDRVRELLMLAEDALVRSHLEAEYAWKKGATEDEMKPVLTLIRHAQWRWDWVAAANGMGFHSPAEALRALGTSIQKAQEAHAELVRILARRGVLEPFALPDVATKEKAQRYIGLDIAGARAEKDAFEKNVLPVWDARAREREAGYTGER